MIRFGINFTRPVGCDKNSRVIVSLTSFPKRIGYVRLTIESLLRQTYQPKAIILYLSKEQFNSSKDIPANLRALKRYGLQIKMVDQDFRSHKKYYYAFQEYEDNLIFLVDDDIIYPSDMLAKAIEIYDNTDGRKIVGRYAHLITRNPDGELKPYIQWRNLSNKKGEIIVDNNLFFGSGGGTLFNPKWMNDDVCKNKLFLELTPLADDVWLNVQARLGGCKIIIYNYGLFLPVVFSENETLNEANNGILNMNDVQIDRTINYYMDKIKYNPFFS